ncbi:MAG: deoxynucleoside kinase [Bacteroidota bacterium]|nr:deoxynucleoside kinase [Bacteroidota bacterium]
MQYNFISIEGNIGAGKTSLAKKLSTDHNARLILESFSDNPFLPKFYKKPKKYAFSLELFFMAERYSQMQQQDLFHSLTISDYLFVKSKLFAQNNLQDDELFLFNKLFSTMSTSIPNPQLVVYLYSSIERLQYNISKRGRAFEQYITAEYLQNIQNNYLDYFHKQKLHPILIIDVTNIDFLKNESDYQKIKSAITSNYKVGVHNLTITDSTNKEEDHD